MLVTSEWVSSFLFLLMFMDHPRGIANPGALCYLIAPLQQLLSVAEFTAISEKAPSTVVLLHNIANWLSETSSQRCFLALRVWKECYHSMGGDIYTQRDASEFYNEVLGRLVKALTGSEQADRFSELACGKLTNILRAADMSDPTHFLRKEERFFSISVTVEPSNGCGRLESALVDFTRTEQVPFRWPLPSEPDQPRKLGPPVLTLKSTKFKQLPKLLAFHLKRFTYDVKRGMKVKLHNRFDFPVVLDMKPFIEIESQQCKVEDSPASCLYRLRGVVVHRGATAYSGHYVSYISSSSPPTDADSGNMPLAEALRGQVWYCCDDDRVTALDGGAVAELVLGGGKETTSVSSGDDGDCSAAEEGVTENIGEGESPAAAAEEVQHEASSEEGSSEEGSSEEGGSDGEDDDDDCYGSAFMLFYERIGN